jgi:NAD(P)-dependent dehydrogenase (short-subunit alcohol dehydrogenase family)
MFGHHGSKAAGNMVGHVLSYDLKERGIAIAMVHPGFLKTEMTQNAGMEEFYEKMGAVTPDEAAGPLVEFVEKLDMEMSGKMWAPMGARGIGNAEEVMGKEVLKHKGPLELPW